MADTRAHRRLCASGRMDLSATRGSAAVQRWRRCSARRGPRRDSGPGTHDDSASVERAPRQAESGLRSCGRQQQQKFNKKKTFVF